MRSVLVLVASVSMLAAGCGHTKSQVAVTAATTTTAPVATGNQDYWAVHPPTTTTTVERVPVRAASVESRPTTTAPPATTPPPPPSGDRWGSTGQVNGYPCGGALPPCDVLQRESGGDPRLWNGGCYAPEGHQGKSPCGTSSASGLWQFVRGTWNGYGGYVNAADAPPDLQNEKAAATWAGGAGCRHWSAC